MTIIKSAPPDRCFRNDTERLEKLFELYTKMTADATKASKGRKGTST